MDKRESQAAGELMAIHLVQAWTIASICKSTGKNLKDVHASMVSSIAMPGVTTPEIEAQACMRLDMIFTVATSFLAEMKAG